MADHLEFAVLWQRADDARAWDRREFPTLREAREFAKGRVRSGWLRHEVDVQDSEGSLNLPL